MPFGQSKTKKPEAKGTCFLDVSAEEAQNLLLSQGKEGDFIIRPSERNPEEQISLSLRHKSDVIHIKIQNTGEVFDLYGGEQFSSLYDLAEYYKEGEKLKLQNGDFINLSNPFFLNTTNDRCERWFHGSISSENAREKLSIHSEGSFIVRGSQRNEENFVLSVKTAETSKSTQSDFTEVVINKNKNEYNIGDGKSFKDLSRLIDYYRKNEITATKDGKDVKFTLKKAVNLGAILAQDIPTRAAELLKQFPGHEKARNGFWEEFEQIAKLENVSDVYSQPRIQGKKEENVKKNRFKNILPYDETRVILRDKDECDYINANYIDLSKLPGLDGLKGVYIATQGCLKNTVGDFWRMVWQENSSIIVMTTRVVEMGKPRCFQYWPEEKGGSLTCDLIHGSITVTFESEEETSDFYIRELKVTRKAITKKGKAEATEEVGTRTVYHFHFPEWPDKMAPKDHHIGNILLFVEAINDKKKKLKDTKPIIVHCSAGIGRTGTFILIDVILNLIKSKKGLKSSIDIPETLVGLRKMRSGLVQTEAQYRFVYLTIRHYIEMIQPGAKSITGGPGTNGTLSIPQDDQKGIYENQPVTQNGTQKQKPKPLTPKPIIDSNGVYENMGKFNAPKSKDEE